MEIGGISYLELHTSAETNTLTVPDLKSYYV